MKNLMTRFFTRTILISFVAMLVGHWATAQQAAPPVNTLQDKIGVWGNPMFLTLTMIALLLAVIINALGRALLSVAKKYNSQNNTIKAIALLIITCSMLIADNGFAQTATAAPIPAQSTYYGLSSLNFWSLISLIAIELIAIGILIKGINNFLRPLESEEAIEQKKSPLQNFMDRLSALKPMEQEKELIMQDHTYDGIQELDNGMPPWLKYMFIVTVAFAFGYLLNYHIFRTGMLQTAEFQNEIKNAELQLAEHRKLSANNIDETNVKLLTAAADLKSGADIFKANCVACHGQNGEGLVGPNFTDDYWKHGGSINDIFKVIKYGVVEKGMKSWQADLSPSQIQLVGSYIKSLRGTNPPNQKAPEGDLYSENAGSAPNDSTVVKTDTTSVTNPDSATVANAK